MRRWLYIPLIIFILIAIEGVSLELLPAIIVQSKSILVAHWALVFIVYVALFFDTRETLYSVYYAAATGLIIDIAYTDVLGVYMFAYGLTIYLVYLLGNVLQVNLIGTLTIGAIGIAFADFLIYIIYAFIGITFVTIADYSYYRLLPTILANIVFLLVLYPLVHQRFNRWSEQLFS